MGSFTPAFFETSSNVPSPRLWKQQVRFAVHSPRTALHGNSFELAEALCCRIPAGCHVDVHIAGHEEIDVAVAIVVGPGGAGAEACCLHFALSVTSSNLQLP